MRFRQYIMLLTLFCLALVAAPQSRADSEKDKEYQVKAAFLYNFIKFVDWPKKKTSDDNTLTIGIIGRDPFGEAFEPLKGKEVKKRKVIIQNFNSVKESRSPGKQTESIRKCHVLFICRSEFGQLRGILGSLKDHSVLTVGDVPNFLESGGVVNFVKHDERIRFEINLTAAKKGKLKVSSKLLRLAKRVVGKKGS